MNILLADNTAFDLNKVPDQASELSFCVFDASNRDNIDYYFNPLLFMETFSCPSAVLRIGEYKVHMPLDWSMVVCDEEMTDLEIVPITSLNDRGFMTVAYNPLNHMVTHPKEVEIVDIYSDIKWYAPKLKHGCMLVSPLEHSNTPICALFVRERNKLPSDLQVGELFI